MKIYDVVKPKTLHEGLLDIFAAKPVGEPFTVNADMYKGFKFYKLDDGGLRIEAPDGKMSNIGKSGLTNPDNVENVIRRESRRLGIRIEPRVSSGSYPHTSDGSNRDPIRAVRPGVDDADAKPKDVGKVSDSAKAKLKSNLLDQLKKTTLGKYIGAFFGGAVGGWLVNIVFKVWEIITIAELMNQYGEVFADTSYERDGKIAEKQAELTRIRNELCSSISILFFGSLGTAAGGVLGVGASAAVGWFTGGLGFFASAAIIGGSSAAGAAGAVGLAELSGGADALRDYLKENWLTHAQLEALTKHDQNLLTIWAGLEVSGVGSFMAPDLVPGSGIVGAAQKGVDLVMPDSIQYEAMEDEDEDEFADMDLKTLLANPPKNDSPVLKAMFKKAAQDPKLKAQYIAAKAEVKSALRNQQ